MKIGFVVFGKSWNTLGLEIICEEINRNFNITPTPADIESAKKYDVLLFSLFWWKHKYDYVKFLYDTGIIPHKRKPILIIGGMETLNIQPLTGFYDYAVIGDGEKIITELLQNIIDKKEVEHPSISVDGQSKTLNIAVSNVLRATHYIEDRTNKLARVEIGRGCKRKCLFCLLSYVKPYRELPIEAIKQLIITSPTNRIALFSSDRASHSHYKSIDEMIEKYKKTNMGTDIRIDSIQKQETATSLRFGIEAFSERVRRVIGKNYKDEQLIEYFDYIFNKLKKPNGERLTTATAYMILGLPSEGIADYKSFGNLLKEIDKRTKNKFTLFLTLNGFSPYYFTPLQFSSVDVYTNFTKIWNEYKPHLDNIVIAQHGGSRNPISQIMQMITIRGDSNSAKLIYNLSVNPSIKSKVIGRTKEHLNYMLKIIEASKIDINFLLGELKQTDKLPWDNVTNPNFSKEKFYKIYENFKRRI